MTEPPAAAASAPFADVVATADAVEATASRLAKADALAPLLTSLDGDDLARAARWLSGRLFPAFDPRAPGTGHALLLAAIARVAGVEAADLRPRLVALGDAGEVAAEALAGPADSGAAGSGPAGSGPEGSGLADSGLADSTHTRGGRRGAGLSIADVAAALDAIADVRGTKAREARVADLLARLGPREARFVVRLLAGDPRIGLRDGGFDEAVARVFGRDGAAVRRAAMLGGDAGETVRLAREDRLADARLRLLHPLRFMLATAADSPEEVARQMPDGFAVEDKYDGIRAQLHVAPAASVEGSGAGAAPAFGRTIGAYRVALFSRQMSEVTAAFPDVAESLAAWAASDPERLGAGAVLDAEIVPVRPRVGAEVLPEEPAVGVEESNAAGSAGDLAIQPFQVLQQRLGRRTPGPDVLAAIPVAVVAYDVLVLGGEAVYEQPFAARRALLEAVGAAVGARSGASHAVDSHAVGSREVGSRPVGASSGDAPARLAVAPQQTATAADLDALFDAARARGNEGLMVKRLDAPYRPGTRGRDWLKVKRALATLDVVVTAAEVGHGKRRHLLSDLTFAVRRSADDPALLNVGKAYSGLTDAELATLTAHLDATTRETFAHGKVRTVEPTVVLEVTFDAVQPSPRHKSGYALRFPRIVRLRPDKSVDEIDTLAEVARLAAGGADAPDAPGAS